MNNMEEKILKTAYGSVHYWVNSVEENKPWLVFLPGLTADYHLYDKQIEFFTDKYNIITWDAPAHGASRPFKLAFTMDDMAEYLRSILKEEKVQKPILIGQSMGGYLSQVYMELYPDAARGFVSIDSASMQKKYYAGWELAMLRHTTGMFLSIPWKMLVKWEASGTATSSYGRQYMRDVILTYDKKEYCHLIGYGFRIVADAVKTNRAYRIDCPALLLCGDKDSTGYVKKYNRAWTKETGYKLVWLAGAGHNSNADAPQEVNRLIDDFVKGINPLEK